MRSLLLIGATAGLFLAGLPIAHCAMSSGSVPPVLHVDFKLKTDSVWPIPERRSETALTLVLEAVNHGPDPVRFPVRDSFRISIQGPDGKLRTMTGGADGIRPSHPISDPIAPGGSFALSLSAHLIRGADDRARLRIEDNFGGVWWIEPLGAGHNLLQMSYESHAHFESDATVWNGRAAIDPVPIQIVAH